MDGSINRGEGTPGRIGGWATIKTPKVFRNWQMGVWHREKEEVGQKLCVSGLSGFL